MVPGFRVRIIPVLGTIPAIFGQIMASYVITQLAGMQVQMEPIVNLDLDHYRTLHQRLIEHEETVYGTSAEVQVFRLVSVIIYCALERLIERDTVTEIYVTLETDCEIKSRPIRNDLNLGPFPENG